MKSRRVGITLLCEDSQHEAFIRRFLKKMGWETQGMRVEKNPAAKGAAEQWVRDLFPTELTNHRQRNKRARSVLIAMIDADNKSVVDRIKEFEEVCKGRNVPFRSNNECAAFAIPKRNIETWIRYLSGEKVCEDENKSYSSKLTRERLCDPAVKNLVRLCQTAGLPSDAPDSLLAACEEYATRIKPCRP
jgi:hypothetical protein